jgi:CheY-like chemotaxis protein
MFAPNKRPRVLVIEDEALVSILIEDMLDELGLECAGSASNIADAMQCVHEIVFDCAILDVNLNGVRTNSIAATLRARNIPFVLATGYGGAELEEEFSGFLELLGKPFDRIALQRAIAKMLPSLLSPKDLEQSVREANDEAGFD